MQSSIPWLVEWSSHPHPEYWIPVNLQATTENSSLSTLLDFIIKSKGKPVSSWLYPFLYNPCFVQMGFFLTGGGGGCQASSGGWEWVGLIQKWKTIKHFQSSHTYNDNRGRKRRWHKSIFKLRPARISCVNTKSKLLRYQKETTQPLRPIQALPTPWVLSTAGKMLRYLRGSYPCLILNFLFNVLFLWYFPLLLSAISLSIDDLLISVLCTRIERSLLTISTRHAPLLLIGYKCVLGLGQTLRSKRFFFVHV